jgi:hypothetical protein
MGAAGLGSLQGVPGHWPLTAGATCAGGGLDRQGELLAATEGGGVPPRPPSLEHGEDLDAAEGSP